METPGTKVGAVRGRAILALGPRYWLVTPIVEDSPINIPLEIFVVLALGGTSSEGLARSCRGAGCEGGREFRGKLCGRAVATLV